MVKALHALASSSLGFALYGHLAVSADSALGNVLAAYQLEEYGSFIIRDAD
jgi:hypothetical protein